MRVRGVQKVKSIIKSCEETLTTLEQEGKAPNEKRICNRLYSVEEAAEMVGRNRTTLLRAAEKGVVMPEKFKTSNKIRKNILKINIISRKADKMQIMTIQQIIYYQMSRL